MRKLMTLTIAMLLTAATQGQVVDSRHISMPASGLPSVVTVLSYCAHGYDETVTFVPAGFLGMMVFFSVSDESVRLSKGKLVGDENLKAEGGNVNGHTNIYWLQCPPFPDVRNTYGVVVTMHDNDGYAGQIVVEIDVYPE